MDLALLTDPTRCPDCAAALDPQPVSCPACELPLRGPLVDRLWTLSLQAAATLEQRARVLTDLRGQRGSGGLPASTASWMDAPLPAWLATPRDAEPAFPAPTQESVTPRQIQRLLLGLGVLLLGVAALIFTVVAWGRIGVGGRTAILAALTASAAAGSVLARRRELPGTAEALASLTLLLLVLDAFGLRASDLAGADRPAGDVYWAGVLALLAALAAAAHAAHPLRTLRLAAAVGAQLPLAFLAAGLEPVVVTIAALAQGTAAILLARRFAGVDLRVVLAVGGALAWLGSAIGAIALAYDDSFPGSVGPAAGAAMLALAALTAAVIAWDYRDVAALARLGAAGALAAGLGAAHAPLERALDRDPATAAGAALLLAGAVLVMAAPLARRAWRDGALIAVAAGAVLAALDIAEPVARAIAGPFVWIDEAWTASADASARDLLGIAWPHSPAVAITAVLLTVAAAAAAWRLRSTDTDEGVAAGIAAGALAAATAIVAPVATDAPYLVGVLGLVGAGGALLVGAALAAGAPAGSGDIDDAGIHEDGVDTVVGTGADTAADGTDETVGFAAPADGAVAAPGRRYVLAGGLAAAGAGTAGIGLLSSLAARPATPLALAVLLAASIGAWLAGTRTGAAPLVRPLAAAAATLAVIAQAGVLTRIAGEPGTHAGVVAIGVAGALAVAAGTLGRRVERIAVEAAAAAGAVGAFGAVTGDALWASHALLVAGVAAALVAARRGRRAVGWAAGLLLTAASWIRLVEANVDAPEAYTTGPALALLAVGWLARRAQPERSSWPAYGPGLSLGLVPSLAVTPGADGLARPLLLGLAALIVVLAGARGRLAAPLVIGGTVLALDALIQLAPYADAVPRWVSIGGAGLLLLVLGATFERRLRDVRRLAGHLGRLA